MHRHDTTPTTEKQVTPCETRTVHTVEKADYAMPMCEHRMKGHGGWKKQGYLSIPVNKWSGACPNRATGLVRGKWKCAAHGGPK